MEAFTLEWSGQGPTLLTAAFGWGQQPGRLPWLLPHPFQLFGVRARGQGLGCCGEKTWVRSPTYSRCEMVRNKQHWLRLSHGRFLALHGPSSVSQLPAGLAYSSFRSVTKMQSQSPPVIFFGSLLWSWNFDPLAKNNYLSSDLMRSSIKKEGFTLIEEHILVTMKCRESMYPCFIAPLTGTRRLQ